MNDVERLAEEIRSAENGGRISTDALLSSETREQRTKHAEAFDRYLRGGNENLSAEQRKVLNEKREQVAGSQTISQTSGSAGGYLVPAGFANEIENATKFFAPLMDSNVCRTLTTDSGAILPFPTSNDTNNSATLIAEGASATELDTAFGTINFSYFQVHQPTDYR